MKLVFLGTSGSIPTVKRGLPAIALKRGRELLLFDVAEGTQRQMALAHLSPMKLDAIFITHLHGDHFLGLAGLAQTLSLMNRTRPLEIYCPAGERERIESYLRVPIYTLTFDIQVRELRPGDDLRREGYRILTSDVDHPVPSLAYALVEDERPGHLDPGRAAALGIEPGPDFSRLKAGQSVKLRDGRVVRPEDVIGPPRPGRKIVYAGDTRPSEHIIELARDADVLIHDCTLADELAEKAAESAHSTPSEAAEVAKQANVRQLVLIHVSPRYEDDDSVLLEQAKKIFPNTVMARDLMELEVTLQE
ncbi:MAG: ribonuclease Z [Candidatus Hodarchaeaceae archaeon]|nr:ribonuclease Z [Candidatus Hodarchaeaceae archaeon]